MKLEKITKMGNRSYQDACGTAQALDLIGERWSLLVMRELMLGARRFSELRASLPGISANVLTQRLERLEAAGVLRRRKLPPPASARVYELTEWGLDAEPIICGLGRWGARSPYQDTSLPLSAVSVMLSLRAMFDPARVPDLAASINLRFGEDVYTVWVRDGALSMKRGEAADADVIVSGTPGAVIGSIYGLNPREELERDGSLEISGDRSVLEEFSKAFALPPKAPA